MDEPIKKYAKWIVVAILTIIALYFSTQVFLLASLPTDPRRAPDLPPEVGEVQFIVLPGDEAQIQTRREVVAAAKRICSERSCDFAVLLGSHVLPGGMSDDDDPKMDEWVGNVYDTLQMPKYMLLGDGDYGGSFDRRVGIREVRWATRSRGFEMPSSTYFFRSPKNGFWMFDTNEQCHGAGSMQTDWLASSLAKHPNVDTRIAFGHDGYQPAQTACLNPFFNDHICGVFDTYISMGSKTTTRDECGTRWLELGAFSSSSQQTDIESKGNSGAFLWVEVTKSNFSVAFYDKYGTLMQP